MEEKSSKTVQFNWKKNNRAAIFRMMIQEEQVRKKQNVPQISMMEQQYIAIFYLKWYLVDEINNKLIDDNVECQFKNLFENDSCCNNYNYQLQPSSDMDASTFCFNEIDIGIAIGITKIIVLKYVFDNQINNASFYFNGMIFCYLKIILISVVTEIFCDTVKLITNNNNYSKNKAYFQYPNLYLYFKCFNVKCNDKKHCKQCYNNDDFVLCEINRSEINIGNKLYDSARKGICVTDSTRTVAKYIQHLFGHLVIQLNQQLFLMEMVLSKQVLILVYMIIMMNGKYVMVCFV